MIPIWHQANSVWQRHVRRIAHDDYPAYHAGYHRVSHYSEYLLNLDEEASSHNLPSTWNVAVFKALTQFYEDHKHDVAGTPVALLPINDVMDFEWFRRVDFIFDPNHRQHDPMLPIIDMVCTRNQDDPESSQQGANTEPSLAESTYSDFLGTHPPTFERTREPLDANHWLRQTESKFGLLECSEHQKLLFAAQQLQGSASAWWANYEASLPAGRRVEWNEFKTAFCAHFIPAGLMQRKFQEFIDLKQGGRNVLQYSETFNHLDQYATDYVNTEDRKRYAFLRGMNATFKECLTWQTTGTYNDLVNAAIVQEGTMRQVEEEDYKRKVPSSASAAPQVKHCLIYTSPTGQRFRASPQQQYQR
ncbi:hypothetical protein PR202_gb29479 [Eleusine coracana subsp. coracana]|uniref:Retrotransposon gag domain-containing protein n=1 Tax=Eleusine coracana subsp. coracana TaxID=191504 RepID=A0AAV5FZH6_ELECO|nr:hypothetical protein PR202_gb29479 [Eleusine coracana subsp. coracana]